MKHHRIKTYGGMDVYTHAFLISALDESNSSASCPGHFTSWGKGTQYQTGDWVSLRAILNTVETGRAPHILDLDTRCTQLHVIATLPHGDSTYYLLGRWVGPRVSHDIVEKKYPCQE
jgi:hypothetical protein